MKVSYCYEEDGKFYCGDSRGECSYYKLLKVDGMERADRGSFHEMCSGSLSSLSARRPYCLDRVAQEQRSMCADEVGACDRAYAMVSGRIHNVVEYEGEEYKVIGWSNDYIHTMGCVVIRKEDQVTVKTVHWSRIWTELVDK